jgi:hypothetical protein
MYITTVVKMLQCSDDETWVVGLVYVTVARA